MNKNCLTFEALSNELWPLHRTVVSKAFDKSLELIGGYWKNGIQTDVSGVESLMWQLNIWRGLKPIPSRPTERWMALADCLDLFKSLTPRDHSKLQYKRI